MMGRCFRQREQQMLMEKEKDMGEVDQSVYYSGPCRPGEEFDFYSKCDGKSVEDLR